jgi:hypothetical protein
VVEVINAQSAVSKGKQKALPLKMSKSFKPSLVIMITELTAQPKLSKPSNHLVPPPEKPNLTTGAPNDFIKTLGELESLTLVTFAELKQVQAKPRKAEGTLDIMLYEVSSFQTKYNL